MRKTQKTSGTYAFAALTIFNVDPGKRYRFRFINAGFNVCPFLLQIEGHNMTIIATEISDVKPFLIDSLYSINGERFDFVLNATSAPRDYWMRVKTMLPCRTITEGFAILRYGQEHKIDVTSKTRVDFPELYPQHLSEDFPTERLFNSPLPKVEDIPLLSLEAYHHDQSIVDSPPDQQFYLFIDSPHLLDLEMENYKNYYKLDCEYELKDNSIPALTISHLFPVRRCYVIS